EKRKVKCAKEESLARRVIRKFHAQSTPSNLGALQFADQRKRGNLSAAGLREHSAERRRTRARVSSWFTATCPAESGCFRMYGRPSVPPERPIRRSAFP